MMASVTLLCFTYSGTTQEVVEVGKGSYYATIPDGYERPSNNNGEIVTPRVSDAFMGAIPTNEWWSSLIWERYAGNSTGQNMYPLPLALKAQQEGLSLAHLQGFNISDVAYFQSFNAAVTISVEGLVAPEVEVAHAGDWSVTASWSDDEQSMQATFGHGLPYVYFDIAGGDIIVEIDEVQGTLIIDQSTVVFDVAGARYALFAPTGSQWTQDGPSVLRSALDGRGYLSIAALPDTSSKTLSLFKEHAHVVVQDTRASWTYDEQAGVVNAHFELEVNVKEGKQTAPLTALFRHQWLHTEHPMLGMSYASPRGLMKLVKANAFDVALPYAGLMPWIPETGAVDNSRLTQFLQEAFAEQDLFAAPDTYWLGKALGRAAQLLPLAEQMGMNVQQEQLIEEMKTELEDWLTAGPASNDDVEDGGLSAYSKIEAENYDQANGVAVCTDQNGIQAVCSFGDGDWIQISDVDFGVTDPPGAVLRVASGVGVGGSALVELRLDSFDGPLVGNGAIANTGGWDVWTDFSIAVRSDVLEQLDGIHDLYVVCDTGYPGDVWNLDWLQFDGGNGGSSGGTDETFFARDDTWSTLIGYPSSYGSASELNDHHFHYGYFIAAAAFVAIHDPEWATSDQWGGMVDLLIKDAANWERDDNRYPYLRNFDPYAGYSLASGHQGFASGNNQESSSEAINFAYGVMLWGQATGRDEIRDLGIYLYASEAAAIAQYWFDVDDIVFPAAFPHPMISIVWNNGGDYATWWTGNVEEIHGINILPITTATLHLGHWPQMIQENWNYLLSRNPGQPTVWQDILWSFLAMSSGQEALASFDLNQSYGSEPGDSRAHTYQWLASMNHLGQPVSDVTADIASYAVFEKGGQRTYMAWNPTSEKRQVVFSDGFRACVAAETVQILNDQEVVCQCQGDLNGDNQVNISDFTMFLIAFGQTGENQADFNGDLIVDINDFSIFLISFGSVCQ